jgi:hypothetical protein
MSEYRLPPYGPSKINPFLSRSGIFKSMGVILKKKTFKRVYVEESTHGTT